MRKCNNQSGNALFLILIAVILFAALSYAVTQSNRSGGNASRESNLITSTTVTQYPSAIRTAITRMLLRGVSVSEFDFTPPYDTNFEVAPVHAKIFHPNGGGAVYQNVDPNTVELDPNNGQPIGMWYFDNPLAVANIGTNAADMIAVLTHVRKGICEQINQQLTGSTAIPDTGQGSLFDGMDVTGTGIDGQPFLCVYTTNDGYSYYHVLLESSE